jgi:DHA2 family multidrug resistance protein
VSAASFVTLSPTLRTEASVFLTLARTIAGAVTVSFAGAILTNSTAVNHARLTEFITPFAGSEIAPAGVDPVTAHAMLEGEIERQATIIGYNNVFGAMVVMALIAAVLIVFCKPQRAGTTKPAAPEDAAALH